MRFTYHNRHSPFGSRWIWREVHPGKTDKFIETGPAMSRVADNPPSYGQHVYMKRSSSAAKLPHAMSNKLICLRIEFLFMAKCSTWHVDNLFINAFRLKFRLSNSTAPKIACSSKSPKQKAFENFFAPAQTKVSLAIPLHFGLSCFTNCCPLLAVLVMAQSGHFFDDVKRELKCSVCQEQFSEIKEPKILKCLHTFCKNCLEAWLRQQHEGGLSCPTCRQFTDCPNNDISRLPSNLFCKQLVEIEA